MLLTTIQIRSLFVCLCLYTTIEISKNKSFLLLQGWVKPNPASSSPAIRTVVSVGYGVCLYLELVECCLPSSASLFKHRLIHCGSVIPAARPHYPLNTPQSTCSELCYIYVIHSEQPTSDQSIPTVLNIGWETSWTLLWLQKQSSMQANKQTSKVNMCHFFMVSQ